MSFFRTDFSEIWPCRRKLWVTWILAAFCRAFVLKLLTVWRKRKRSWGRDHLALNLLVANPFLQRLSGVSKQMRDRTLPIFTWLKACACVVESLKSQCWEVTSEKIHCNGVNVHLYKFLKINIQPFKTYFSMYEHLFAFTRFQNRETMKYTVRTVPDLKLCKCAGEIVWTLKTCLWKK